LGIWGWSILIMMNRVDHLHLKMKGG